MSGTRSPSRTEPATDHAAGEPGRWPVWKLAILLYPFAGTAVWINLFMLSLLTSWLGLAVLSPQMAALLQQMDQDARGRACFIIGGAWGLDDCVRQKACKMIRLSDMTLPHELARVVLL